MSAPLLDVRGLSVRLPVSGELRPVLSDVSLRIDAGEVVGLVGESGSGKSMTARAIARLLPAGAETRGAVDFNGSELLGADQAQLRQVRMREIAMVFQDPRAHVNPVRRIGDYMCEAMRINFGQSAEEATRRALELLELVGMPDPPRQMRQYPHQLSGGMLQRVMIAAALVGKPQLLLADEPTTALDVTIQSEIIATLGSLQRENGLAMLFITHDLELAAATCDRICVMYAGRIVEEQPATALFARPLHPYTAALIASRPTLHSVGERLHAIPGRPIDAFEAPAGCPFAPRCGYAQQRCAEQRPEPTATGGGARVACLRADELGGRLAGARSEA